MSPTDTGVAFNNVSAYRATESTLPECERSQHRLIAVSPCTSNMATVQSNSEARSRMRTLDWARAGIKTAQLNDSSRSSNIYFLFFRFLMGTVMDINKIY